ncbi:MAG: hypothetical protein U1F36_08180 [Planctomycetota bacterium]
MTTTPCPVRGRAGNDSERGTALILALIFTIVSAGIVLTGALVERGSRERTNTQFRVEGQAVQFARAGLTEAMSWFRRQVTQPVLRFDPIVDMNAVPPIIDSMEPEVGVVREFRVRGRVWGRYEVWKEWAEDPDPERVQWRQNMAAHDVSRERQAGNGGTSWRIRSMGYVFEREDETSRFDAAPNHVLAMEGVEAEILRRKLQPPGQAALVLPRADWCRINSNGIVEGTSRGVGVFYRSNTGRVTIATGGQITGSPAQANQSAALDLSPQNVFGATYFDLRGSADLVITDMNDFPRALTDNATIILEIAGTAVFDRDHPLRGRGLVYVNGPCTIEAGSNSVFNGLLYVNGDFAMNAPSEIEGAVVCTGRATVTGSGDRSTIRYGDAVLNTLRQDVGQYRYLGAFRGLHSNR